MVTAWLVTMPKISLLVFILEFQGSTQLTNWSSSTYLLLISSLLSLIIGTIGGLSQYRI
jgi:NADH-ubiquinone oxidoreductase chain 2